MQTQPVSFLYASDYRQERKDLTYALDDVSLVVAMAILGTDVSGNYHYDALFQTLAIFWKCAATMK